MRDMYWKKKNDKKLRIKLIVSSMVSLLLVLCVIEGVVGVLNYKKIVRDADRVLEVLEENSGTFPKKIPFDQNKTALSCLLKYPMNQDIFCIIQ